MKIKNKEDAKEFSIIRHNLGLINFGLEKEDWKDFSNLFYGNSEISITSFYEKYKKSGKQSDLGLNATEDNSAADITTQNGFIDPPAQKIDDVFSKTDEEEISDRISVDSETGLISKQRVNEAFNTLVELIPVIEGDKNNILNIISPEQIKTIQQLQDVILKPRNKTRKGGSRKNQADQSLLFESDK